MAAQSPRGFYRALKVRSRDYRAAGLPSLFAQVDRGRTVALAADLARYIGQTLPAALERRSGLSDYRTNPYVLMTSASIMSLGDPSRFADFLFNNKLYMGLETSFGKLIESAGLGYYPVGSNPDSRWHDPPEKLAEEAGLAQLPQEEKAAARDVSVWREIDKSCVVGNRRYLTTIKSGPNCINDSQVDAMKAAIATHYGEWMHQTRESCSDVTELDIVIGLTYGTDRTTNNKENQILVKLLQHGFEEEDRDSKPGVLIDSDTRAVRLYRVVGQDFWAFIGKPNDPTAASFVFLEFLLALAKALAEDIQGQGLEDRVNRKIDQLANAISQLKLPRDSLPDWIRDTFSEDELFWLQTAATAFFDEGI